MVKCNNYDTYDLLTNKYPITPTSAKMDAADDMSLEIITRVNRMKIKERE